MRPEKMTSICGRWNWGRCRKAIFTATLCTMIWDSIVRDIREAHRKDKTTADPQPTLDDVKEKFEQALEQGSRRKWQSMNFATGCKSRSRRFPQRTSRRSFGY